MAKGDWTARVVLAACTDIWLNKHLDVERDAMAVKVVVLQQILCWIQPVMINLLILNK